MIYDQLARRISWLCTGGCNETGTGTAILAAAIAQEQAAWGRNAAREHFIPEAAFL